MSAIALDSPKTISFELESDSKLKNLKINVPIGSQYKGKTFTNISATDTLELIDCVVLWEVERPVCHYPWWTGD